MKVWIGQSLLLLSQKMEKVANDSNNNNNYCTNENYADDCSNLCLNLDFKIDVQRNPLFVFAQ